MNPAFHRLSFPALPARDPAKSMALWPRKTETIRSWMRKWKREIARGVPFAKRSKKIMVKFGFLEELFSMPPELICLLRSIYLFVFYTSTFPILFAQSYSAFVCFVL